MRGRVDMRSRALTLFSAALIVAAIAGCSPKNEGGSGGPSGGNPSPSGGSTPGSGAGSGQLVGVSLSSRNHNFFLGMEQGVTDELNAQGLKYEAVVAEDSSTKQQEQIDTLIAKGAKAIIMVPVDAQQAATAVEAANKANIPVFCIDRRVTAGGAKVTCTVETDNVAMGEAAAQHALKLLCDRRKLDSSKPEDLKKLKTTVVHLWGLKAASSAQDRAAGFDKVINATNTPGIKVIPAVGDFSAKTSQEIMAPMLRANPDIELVYCHNDDNATGALNAILDTKKQREAATDPKRIFIVGMDGNKPAIEAIRKGDIEASVSQEPIEMGKVTAQQVKKVLDGGKPDKEYVAIPHHLVTQKEANEGQGKLWSDQLRGAK
jgi:ribose transport system substrate-binding protein